MYPRLTPDEERALVSELHDPHTTTAGRQRARDTLFASCWPYVLKQARRFRNQKCSTHELAQVGALGLLRAIEKFDATRGKLLTYAAPWITQELTRYVSATQFIVRLDTSPALISAKSLVRRGKVSTPDELASETGLPLETAERVMYTLSTGDAHLVVDGWDVDLPSGDVGADTRLDEVRRARRVREAIAALPDAQRRAFELHHLQERPLAEVGSALGCSYQNVHQLVRRAYDSLTQRGNTDTVPCRVRPTPDTP